MSRYAFTAETVRDLMIGLMRGKLTSGNAFPSAAMTWLAIALEQAHADLLETALEGGVNATMAEKHAPLLEDAARRMRALANEQRRRDDAHYEDG